MRISKAMELGVGSFLLGGVLALLLLAWKVADVQIANGGDSYTLYAKFEDIGGLKVRSPVKIGGVVIGRVTQIDLDEMDYLPTVTLAIDRRYDQLPENTALAIQTSGLLGEQFVGLEPGFILDDEEMDMLVDGDSIDDTRSALVLEKLISQYLFSQED